jgi:hypothetical protein
MIINDKRALAYVVTVDEIKPIEGYDRVEYARTNGWWVIISKNDNAVHQQKKHSHITVQWISIYK